MANAGVGLARNGSEGNAPYWRGNDAQSLEAAFTPLSCPTDWEPSPDADDFIRLSGSACTEFKSGEATFTAEFPCGVIVVE